MIEIAMTIPNPDKIVLWLQAVVKPHLTPDVSRYAKGRLRVWLGQEPSLTSPIRLSPGLPVDEKILSRLAELIQWPFDYCLATYSGDLEPIGISPHRDAAFADYEAMGLHLSGECQFAYWNQRKGFSKSPATKDAPMDGPASDVLVLEPGQVVRFNCKNVHSATPGVGRWNLNFWKAKP